MLADVMCPSLPPVGEHVMLSGTSVSYGSTLTFACCAGYYVTDSSETTCLADGFWSATDVECLGESYI